MDIQTIILKQREKERIYIYIYIIYLVHRAQLCIPCEDLDGSYTELILNNTLGEIGEKIIPASLSLKLPFGIY